MPEQTTRETDAYIWGIAYQYAWNQQFSCKERARLSEDFAAWYVSPKGLGFALATAWNYWWSECAT